MPCCKTTRDSSSRTQNLRQAV
jgi:Polyketide cyclase / dehydrase and lipid transport